MRIGRDHQPFAPGSCDERATTTKAILLRSMAVTIAAATMACASRQPPADLTDVLDIGAEYTLNWGTDSLRLVPSSTGAVTATGSSACGGDPTGEVVQFGDRTVEEYQLRARQLRFGSNLLIVECENERFLIDKTSDGSVRAQISTRQMGGSRSRRCAQWQGTPGRPASCMRWEHPMEIGDEWSLFAPVAITVLVTGRVHDRGAPDSLLQSVKAAVASSR